MKSKPENEVEMSNPLVGEDIDEITINTEEYGQDNENDGWDAVGD